MTKQREITRIAQKKKREKSGNVEAIILYSVTHIHVMAEALFLLNHYTMHFRL